MKQCHKCRKEWTSVKKQPGVKEVCEGCNAYLHCCMNCRFHDKSKHNECAIPTTEWVGDRQGCNFCDEFEFADAKLETGRHEQKEKAQSAFRGLFDSSDDETDSAPTDFDKLFGE